MTHTAPFYCTNCEREYEYLAGRYKPWENPHDPGDGEEVCPSCETDKWIDENVEMCDGCMSTVARCECEEDCDDTSE